MATPPQWQNVGGNAAQSYEQHLVPAMFAPWAPTLIDLAGVYAGDHVLDVACGTGVVARLASTRVGQAGRVVGLDVNGAMLSVARLLPAVAGAPIEWLEASVQDIPLTDASFNVVLCQQGLQQFTDRPSALREMHRVLEPGGRLAASVWSQIESSPGMAALVKALERHVSKEAANNRRAPFALGHADELETLIRGARFGDVRIETVVETARFPSPEMLVEAQLAATPLSTLGTLSGGVRRKIAQEVREALSEYIADGTFEVPMEAHTVIECNRATSLIQPSPRSDNPHYRPLSAGRSLCSGPGPKKTSLAIFKRLEPMGVEFRLEAPVAINEAKSQFWYPGPIGQKGELGNGIGDILWL